MYRMAVMISKDGAVTDSLSVSEHFLSVLFRCRVFVFVVTSSLDLW